MNNETSVPNLYTPLYEALAAGCRLEECWRDWYPWEGKFDRTPDHYRVMKEDLHLLAQPTTPQPPEGFHLATDEELDKLPEGTLANSRDYPSNWRPSRVQVGDKVSKGNRQSSLYACPDLPTYTPLGSDITLDMEKGASEQPVIGNGFYRDAAAGTFGPSEWLDLLMAVQNGRCSCMRAKEIIERELTAPLKNQQQHDWWGAGEPNCPKDIKATNGELHTLRCKRCGQTSPRSQMCLGPDKTNTSHPDDLHLVSQEAKAATVQPVKSLGEVYIEALHKRNGCYKKWSEFTSEYHQDYDKAAEHLATIVRAERQAEVELITNAAHAAGWNGVENSKLLHVFIEGLAEERDSLSKDVSALCSALDAHDATEGVMHAKELVESEKQARLDRAASERRETKNANAFITEKQDLLVRICALEAQLATLRTLPDDETLQRWFKEALKVYQDETGTFTESRIQAGKHFASLLLSHTQAEAKDEPKTFTGPDGQEWNRYTATDIWEMPCNGEKDVFVLCGETSVRGPNSANSWNWVNLSDPCNTITGWRYADTAPTEEKPQVALEPKLWIPKVGDVVTLKSGGSPMTLAYIGMDDQQKGVIYALIWSAPNGDVYNITIPANIEVLKPA